MATRKKPSISAERAAQELAWLQEHGIPIGKSRAKTEEARRIYIHRQYQANQRLVQAGKEVSRQAGRGAHGQAVVPVTHLKKEGFRHEVWEVALRGGMYVRVGQEDVLLPVAHTQVGSQTYEKLYKAAGSPKRVWVIFYGKVKTDSPRASYPNPDECEVNTLQFIVKEGELRDYMKESQSPEDFAESITGEQWCEVWSIGMYPASERKAA